MKKSVRSTDPCEPAGTMHVRCERYVARALEIFGERQSACGAKIHWRVSSRGEAGAPHVRATKGSDRAGRGAEEWHAQRVGLLLRRWREVSYLLWYNPREVLIGQPFMVQPPEDARGLLWYRRFPDLPDVRGVVLMDTKKRAAHEVIVPTVCIEITPPP